MKIRSAAIAKLLKNVPLSKCDLWNQQRDFFEQQGINAWDAKVPFYVTSNPYIANSYANIIIRFLQDCINHKNINPLKPFYILELGAGSGAFGFYLIKQLLELRSALNMTAISFVYVMTDFTEKNIQYWRKHPALQTYIDQGILDFALYDVEIDKEIILLNSGKILTKKITKQTPDNPLIVLANYVFDTISHDLFQIKKGKLQQGLIKRSAKMKPTNNQTYLMLNELDKNFSYHDIKLPHYKDEHLDAILSHYQKNLTDNYFLFPIGGLQSIKNLLEAINQNLLMIVTDKGYAEDFEFYTKKQPVIAVHDQCFSMMVNFDSIGRYFQQQGGDYYHQPLQKDIITSTFIAGDLFKHLPETKQAITTYLDSISHSNLYNLYNHIITTKLSCTLEVLISYLSMSQWDSRVFDLCFGVILSEVKSAHVSIIRVLINGMPKIAANFYYLPGAINTLANIGIFFQEIQDYRSAIHYYSQSIAYFGEASTILYNIGVCHYFLGEYKKALAKFHYIVTTTSDCIMAKGWIAQIKAEIKSRIQSAKITPHQ